MISPMLLTKLAKSYLSDINRAWKDEHLIKKYQDKKIRQLVKYAYTIPLYHNKYKKAGVHPSDIKEIADIVKLPLVSKKDFRGKTSESLLPKNQNINKYIVSTTSGSTGQPATFYNEHFTIYHSLIGFIRIFRAYDLSWRKNRIATLADLSPDSIEHAFFTGFGMSSLNKVLSFKNIKVFDISEKAEVLIKKLEEFNPDLLGGYPANLSMLANLKNQGFAKNLQPEIVITTGAVLDEYTREKIKKSFGSKLSDMYGATESSPIAFQCKNENYHVNDDYVYFEYINHKEKEEKYGDGGNLVITRLYGKGTPIIRYTGLSDFIKSSDKKCSCGMNTSLIEYIGGRKVDSIVLPNGDLIPPFALTGIPHRVMQMFKTEKLLRFQIVQEKIDEIDVLLVLDKKLKNAEPKNEIIFKELKKQLQQKLGKDIKINVKEVKKIQTIRSGTAAESPVVISKIAR
jgi:phenylacetate-CoA ligase